VVSVGVIKIRCDACKEPITGKYIQFSDGSIFCNDCYKYLTKCTSCKKPVIGGDDNQIDGLCPLCYKRAPKCDICEKAIIGSYTRFTDKSIACDVCMKKYVKCDRCGKPVVRYTKIRGNVLCKNCLTNAPRCHVCNNPIIGTFWVIGKEHSCDYCYKNYERCNLCGMPSQFLFTVHEKKICYSCQEKAKRCSACGLPIVGRYYNYKFQSGIFCEYCEKQAPHCDSCSRPVGLQYIAISDGRKICFECERSAIIDEKQLHELVDLAMAGVNELGLKIKHKINYRLISKKLLDERIQETEIEDTSGRNLGLFHRKANKMNIYIQSHLPLQMTLGTICHELGHAWQSENIIIENQPLELKEGFCEWVSYKVLMKYGYQGQAEMISSRKDLYGKGFKNISQIEKENGIQGMIDWIKTANFKDF